MSNLLTLAFVSFIKKNRCLTLFFIVYKSVTLNFNNRNRRSGNWTAARHVTTAFLAWSKVKRTAYAINNPGQDMSVMEIMEQLHISSIMVQICKHEESILLSIMLKTKDACRQRWKFSATYVHVQWHTHTHMRMFKWEKNAERRILRLIKNPTIVNKALNLEFLKFSIRFWIVPLFS